ncbi:MAG: hypothetical protein IJ493_01725 [Clostridia bacterium]|nr:hypothetical protein [Clostridia bacterium]
MRVLALLLTLTLLMTGCAANPDIAPAEPSWHMGFGSARVAIPDADEPLYIAGYRNGRTITGVLDNPLARAVWMDCGGDGILFLVIDCVGLTSDWVKLIRARVGEFCDGAVNVISTHTHAGIDTMGLWGPIAMEGKNAAFMENLLDAAVEAARTAIADRRSGTLAYAAVPTEGMQRDSRDPQVYDTNLYQLRFEPETGDGIRLMLYAAHAESLRGDNTMVSADYPGVMADIIKAETGDDCVYMPGAIGGLIMTVELAEPFDAAENLRLTGERLAEYALSAEFTPVEPFFEWQQVAFDIPMDNMLFRYYKFLGILQSDMHRRFFGGYSVTTELTAVRMGGLTLALLPGEIFPELVYGGALGDGNPQPLGDIAAGYGAGKLLIAGLANDEIGYIVPPGDFLLDDTLPWIESADGHYEETNSVGAEAASCVAEAFAKALEGLYGEE